ncbi:MAG: hypothetical protein Ct9H300mP28_17740 [Pseudomonadota bacterium]|nr:MAG: hypothetical protein Ct9H300mP28_17740 [Pseudomonadota bacterium]
MPNLNELLKSVNKIGAENVLKVGQNYFLWLVPLIIKFKIFLEFSSAY